MRTVEARLCVGTAASRMVAARIVTIPLEKTLVHNGHSRLECV